MKLSLVVMTPGSNQGKSLEIKLSQFVVGRDAQCHLRPASPMISKRHCAILQREQKAFVCDFDSTNGTFVNNEPVKGEMELQNGDQLKIGPLLFTVNLEISTPVNRPTPPPPNKAKAKTVRVGKSDSPLPSPAGKPAAAAASTVGAANAVSAEQSDDSSSDDDIAAMLLSLHDDGAGGTSGGIAEVPEGSTVHDMPLPPELAAQAAQNEKEKPKAAGAGNTSQAAKTILEKYMKRPRPS